MVVVAVMPAAGLMISIGKTIPMINADWAFLITTGGVIENIVGQLLVTCIYYLH